MHTTVHVLANTLEGLLVCLTAFVVATVSMGAVGPVTIGLALLESLAVVLVWTRIADARLSR